MLLSRRREPLRARRTAGRTSTIHPARVRPLPSRRDGGARNDLPGGAPTDNESVAPVRRLQSGVSRLSWIVAGSPGVLKHGLPGWRLEVETDGAPKIDVRRL